MSFDREYRDKLITFRLSRFKKKQNSRVFYVVFICTIYNIFILPACLETYYKTV